MNLKYDGPLSNLAFNCNLRHYSEEFEEDNAKAAKAALKDPAAKTAKGGVKEIEEEDWEKLFADLKPQTTVLPHYKVRALALHPQRHHPTPTPSPSL